MTVPVSRGIISVPWTHSPVIDFVLLSCFLIGVNLTSLLSYDNTIQYTEFLLHVDNLSDLFSLLTKFSLSNGRVLAKDF